jgi:hypothetical protein
MIELALETRAQRPIPNWQSEEISAFEINIHKKFERDYGGKVEFRTGMIPIYNCHGLTFGSRRTLIFDPAIVRQILEDDRYNEISWDKTRPGDILVYFTPKGDVEHSGIVITPPDDQLKMPKVLSKWGRSLEAIHWANVCPYSFEYHKYYRIQG